MAQSPLPAGSCLPPDIWFTTARRPGLVGAGSPFLPMNPTTAETDKISDNTLLGTAAGSCAAAGLLATPVAGLAVGLALAAVLMTARRRMPTGREIIKVLAALAVTCAVVLVLADWTGFKQGIIQGFRR